MVFLPSRHATNSRMPSWLTSGDAEPENDAPSHTFAKSIQQLTHTHKSDLILSLLLTIILRPDGTE